MAKEYICVNVGNHFCVNSFGKVCALLESGDEIHIGASCIEYARAIMVEAFYARELRLKYGERLVRAYADGLVVYKLA